MAPPVRSKKRKGFSRMDAAVDSMRKYGFSEKAVRNEMKNLLNIYGEDGWPFIEDDSYRVLLENLLEKSVEEEKRQKDSHLEYGSGDENKVASEVGPSSQFVECSNAETLQIVPLSPSEETNAEALQIAPLSLTDETNAKQSPTNNTMALDIGDTDVVGKNAKILRARIYYGRDVTSRPYKIRKPCYGWISNSDDED